MCGIIGQIRFSNSHADFPDIRSISHRGPDDKGEWLNTKGNVYLGHTRLAILDLTSAGHQPMVDSSERFHITFNGEIYNHLELRRLLPTVCWRGTSDTETLLELYSHKGLEALPMLKGMFAFALHDAEDESIFLVRDRLGIKPLWYHLNHTAFSFASEVRALLLGNECKLNRTALSEYVAYGRMPGTGEVLNGIQSLKPGEWLKVKPTGEITFDKWWPTPKQFILRETPPKKISQHVNVLVKHAIEEHLISDVGVGAFLSGGIDSSIVTLVAGKKIGKDLKTFTIGFPQSSYDERRLARIVAQKAGTDHHELEISEDNSLEWVVDAVKKLDLPSVDAINTYIVSKAVRDIGLKVALSGLGGDELFGGYPSFKTVPLLKLLESVPEKLRRRIISLMPKNIQEKLTGLVTYSPLDLTLARRRFVSIPSLKRMGLENGTPRIELPEFAIDTMGMISWAEIQGYMIPMLLRDSDQMSMTTGLEIRVPFLDHELMEEVLCIPEKYKRGRHVKHLLVDAFKDILPSEIYNRKKQGFALPMENWIRGPLANFTNEGIEAAADFFKLKEPLLKKASFDKGKSHWSRIWTWCILGHWLVSRNPLQHAPTLNEKQAFLV